MSMERLSQQVDAYVAWKRELMREITRYRSWLEHNRLNSEAVQAKLERALKESLQALTDEIANPFGGKLLQRVFAPGMIHGFGQGRVRIDERSVEIEQHSLVTLGHTGAIILVTRHP